MGARRRGILGQLGDTTFRPGLPGTVWSPQAHPPQHVLGRGPAGLVFGLSQRGLLLFEKALASLTSGKISILCALNVFLNKYYTAF